MRHNKSKFEMPAHSLSTDRYCFGYAEHVEHPSGGIVHSHKLLEIYDFYIQSALNVAGAISDDILTKIKVRKKVKIKVK